MIFLAGWNIYSQNAEISGRVTHKGEPVPLVNIYLKNSVIGSTTNNKGEFVIKAPLGHHEIILQAIGFKSIKEHLDVLNSEPQMLDFSLQEDVTGLDQVVISASRSGQLRHTAPVIVSVTSEKEFKATQAISLGDGLTFQPGLRMETNCQN